jgi:hypothetical protein
MAPALIQQARVAIVFDNFHPRLRAALPLKTGRQPAHEKITGYLQNTQDNTMEAERINLIGNSLEDLAARAADLRRYL